MAKGRIIDFEGAIVTLFRPEVRAHNLLYRCPASDWPSPDLPFYDDRLECVLGATGRRPCTTVGPHPNGSTAIWSTIGAPHQFLAPLSQSPCLTWPVASRLHQVDVLARPENSPLPGFKIP